MPRARAPKKTAPVVASDPSELEEPIPMEVDDNDNPTTTTVKTKTVKKVTKRGRAATPPSGGDGEEGEDEDAKAVAPRPTKVQRTALGESKQQPKVNGESSSAPAPAEPETSKKSKGKGVVRTASVRSKKQPSPATVSRSPEPPAGTLYCFGNNDCGQLGFECEKRKFPALVPELQDKKMKAIACGGMHTIVLEENGVVWSFGLNDDKALGRHTEDEEEAFEPGKVEGLPNNIIQISAGDSHSAALTADGKVYIWGCFKDTNGNFGLIADNGEICRERPVCISDDISEKIVKICSGGHHLAMLGEEGRLFTCGAGEQGQLGRKLPTRRVTRSMGTTAAFDPQQERKEYLLKPALVVAGRNQKFNDIWTGEFATYCSSKKNEIFVCGLNNYSQLGIANTDVIETPTKQTSFLGRTWKQIAAGQHHTVALDENGTVYTLGRSSDGRLGHEGIPADQDRYMIPTVVQGLENKKCVQVGAGGSTSYAITDEGHLYSWGFGENYQLATGDEDDRNTPFRCKGSRDGYIGGDVLRVAAGGQHVALTVARQEAVNGGTNVNGSS